MKTRTVEFIDKEVREIIKKRGEVVKKGRKINEKRDELQKQAGELDQELNKLGLKLGKYEDKIRPWVDMNIIPILSETEDVQTVDAKGEKIIVEIYDKVEDYKEQVIKASKQRKEESEQTKPIEGKTSK